MFKSNTVVAVLLLVSASAQSVLANTTPVKSISHEWANISFNLPESQRTSKFSQLERQVKKASKVDPENAELLAWSGIISASYAGSRGGLGALKIAHQAKKSLQNSLRLDPEVLSGGAAVSLATLYYKVPGWPIGFGDDKKAEGIFTKTISKYPHSLTANYFYGDFLMDEKRFKEAQAVLLHAAKIPPREDSMLADQARHDDILHKLALLEKMLK